MKGLKEVTRECRNVPQVASSTQTCHQSRVRECLQKKINKVCHKFQSDCTNLDPFWIFDFKKSKIMNVSDFKLQRLYFVPTTIKANTWIPLSGLLPSQLEMITKLPLDQKMSLRDQQWQYDDKKNVFIVFIKKIVHS